ncbi:MAG: tRNA (5-methylaminomethyl-2-thiouridine)(34)-methyltransferase MnmD [Bergeyella zoohelcum]|nr:tRNA (5-methylaminomethyl-2-thiouridine)(34)-methyltransferase MnmD [Bergeyella zoohelcum]
MKKREIKTTNDGSKTLFISELNEGYHSGHGALQEAVYVFIKNGFNLVEKCEINILELGFGTGLNVLVTIDEFLKNNKNQIVRYFSLEKYPVSFTEIEDLGYNFLFDNEKMTEINQKIHTCEWEKEVEILPNFFLTKIQSDFFYLENLQLPPIDLVYFDCFGARVQPDLWELPLLKIVTDKMTTDSLFTTYSSKGSVRRALKELGLNVEKKAGPPGKREMINAWKSTIL